MADSDLELREEGERFVLLALPALLSSVISPFFTQNNAPPLDPPLAIPNFRFEKFLTKIPVPFDFQSSCFLADFPET